MQQVVPLESLRAGERGRIHDVYGRTELVGRLEEMGFRAGAAIRMLRPGTPCIIVLEDHRLTFRGEQAAFVLVELDAACPA
ncbi:MAG: FeoA family protein [Planctomycetales bacterium]